jgi:hypothetical protein
MNAVSKTSAKRYNETVRKIAEVPGFIGGRCRDRTYDPLIKRLIVLVRFQSVSCKISDFLASQFQWLRAEKQNGEIAI